MAFSPSTKHKTTSSPFSSIVDSAVGAFTQSLTVSGVPVSTDPGTNAFSGALLIKTDSQNMLHNAFTKITWQSEEYDVGDWFATSGDIFFTVPAGVTRVKVTATLLFSAHNTGFRMLSIVIDSGSGYTGDIPGLVVERESQASVSAILDISSYAIPVQPGDKIAIEGFQNSGVTLNTTTNTANWFSIEAVSGGVGFIGPIGATGPGASSFAGAMVKLTSGQSFEHQATDVLDWDAELYDDGDWFDTGGDTTIFTVPSGVGHVRVGFSAQWGSTASENKKRVEIQKNGANFDGMGFNRDHTNDVSSGVQQVFTAVVAVVPGDTFRARARQTVGSPLSINSLENTWFYIEAVSGGVGFTGVTGAQGVQGFTGGDGAAGPAGPTEFFQKFDTTHSPVALYNFEEDLTDSSGNGFNLTVANGSERYTSVDGMKAFHFSGADRLLHGSESELTITGDITVQFLVVSYRDNTAQTLLVYGFDTDSNATFNNLYEINQLGERQLCWTHENASQANQTYEEDAACLTQGSLAHVAIVRVGADITFYLDGVQAGATSSGLDDAANGTASVLYIGSNNTNSRYFSGAMASVKIIDSALTAQQIADEYARTLGGRVRK